ncbi:flavoprotein [Toxoplasma gondii MAS]|uniref:Flavoprotein n=1 Tax=Toxoplasma gondii MAS TaxID=943118 RepID=A0A086Q2A7_TOXGO|nr:flavoprotein [Toxoplasma gondii MAS]
MYFSAEKMGRCFCHCTSKRQLAREDLSRPLRQFSGTLHVLPGITRFCMQTCVARAWDFEKPFVVFPAMNSLMWKHPLSAHQLSILRSFGVKVVDPVEKTLACGDTGVGALPPPRSVAAEIFRVVSPAPGPLSEKEREENGRLRGDTETDCSQSDASACSMQTQRF